MPVLNIGEKGRVGSGCGQKGKGEGGVAKTPNLRHVWVRLGEYRRVWEEGGEVVGGVAHI